MDKGLRGYLEQLEREKPEDLLVVDRECPADYTLTSLVGLLEEQNRYPVVMQQKVAGYDLPMVANLFGDRSRVAAMLGTTPERFAHEWQQRIGGLKSPRTVQQAAVQEMVDTDAVRGLGGLPVSRHFRQDAGPYIASGIVVARDPDTGVHNLSFHRMQYKGQDRFGISLHSRGHLWDYYARAEKRGVALPIAVVIGCHPLIYLAAGSKMAMEQDEYALAGALMGTPVDLVRCVTRDVLVPAWGEIVLEGEILPEIREDEGPFGEYTGYATDRSTRNVVQITAVTRRRVALYMDLIPGYSSEHLLLGRMAKEAEVVSRMKEKFPGIRAINFPRSGTHFHAYMSMKKTAEGQPRQALMLLLGLDMYLKWVVAVDDDIDVFNEEEVLWALATRMQPDTGQFVVPAVMCNLLDPSSRDGMSAKMATDATKPLDWSMVRCTRDPQADDLAREILGQI